jgi:hypothetical protein
MIHKYKILPLICLTELTFHLLLLCVLRRCIQQLNCTSSRPFDPTDTTEKPPLRSIPRWPQHQALACTDIYLYFVPTNEGAVLVTGQPAGQQRIWVSMPDWGKSICSSCRTAPVPIQTPVQRVPEARFWRVKRLGPKLTTSVSNSSKRGITRPRFTYLRGVVLS